MPYGHTHAGEQIINIMDDFVATQMTPDPEVLAAAGVSAKPFVQVRSRTP